MHIIHFNANNKQLTYFFDYTNHKMSQQLWCHTGFSQLIHIHAGKLLFIFWRTNVTWVKHQHLDSSERSSLLKTILWYFYFVQEVASHGTTEKKWSLNERVLSTNHNKKWQNINKNVENVLKEILLLSKSKINTTRLNNLSTSGPNSWGTGRGTNDPQGSGASDWPVVMDTGFWLASCYEYWNMIGWWW